MARVRALGGTIVVGPAVRDTLGVTKLAAHHSARVVVNAAGIAAGDVRGLAARVNGGFRSAWGVNWLLIALSCQRRRLLATTTCTAVEVRWLRCMHLTSQSRTWIPTTLATARRTLSLAATVRWWV